MKFTTDYLDQAQEVVMKVFKDSRAELLDAYGNVEHELKGDSSAVTKLDKEVEKRIRDALSTFDSSVGFVGEEFGQEGDKHTFWLIDPIDGTESFIRGLPACRNMVTLMDNEQPVMALIYRFVTDQLCEARKGKGAFLNGERLHVSDRPLARAWLEASLPIDDPSARALFLEIRKHIHGYSIRREFTEIATGQLDGIVAYKSGGGPWDYVPRALLITEAGGKATNVGSDTFDYRIPNVVAANPVIFDQLRKIIASVATS